MTTGLGPVRATRRKKQKHVKLLTRIHTIPCRLYLQLYNKGHRMPTLKTITENMYSTSDSSLETGLNKSCLLSGSEKKIYLSLNAFTFIFSSILLFRLLHKLLCKVCFQGSSILLFHLLHILLCKVGFQGS